MSIQSVMMPTTNVNFSWGPIVRNIFQTGTAGDLKDPEYIKDILRGLREQSSTFEKEWSTLWSADSAASRQRSKDDLVSLAFDTLLYAGYRRKHMDRNSENRMRYILYALGLLAYFFEAHEAAFAVEQIDFLIDRRSIRDGIENLEVLGRRTFGRANTWDWIDDPGIRRQVNALLDDTQTWL